MKSNFLNKAKGVLTLLGIVVAVWVIFAIIQPSRFANTNTLFIMFQQAFIPSVLGAGLYFIIVMGLYDFSLGSIMVLAGIIGGLLFQKTVEATESMLLGYVVFFVACIIISVVCELLNGFLYIKLRVPSMIISVGLMMVFETLGIILGGGRGVSLGRDFKLFGKLPYNIIVGVIALLIAFLIFTYSRQGIHIRAIGSNELVAKSSGINTNKAKLWGYGFCGLFIGIASVLSLSYGGTFQGELDLSSMSRNFVPLMGCFVGVAFKKNVNPIFAIFCGEFLIKLITTGIMTLGGDATLQDIFTGIILLVIVAYTMRASKDIHIIVK